MSFHKFGIQTHVLKLDLGAGEVAQSLAEDPGSIFSTHMVAYSHLTPVPGIRMPSNISEH